MMFTATIKTEEFGEVLVRFWLVPQQSITLYAEERARNIAAKLGGQLATVYVSRHTKFKTEG